MQKAFQDISVYSKWKVFDTADGKSIRAENLGHGSWAIYILDEDSNAYIRNGSCTTKLKGPTCKQIYAAYLNGDSLEEFN